MAPEVSIVIVCMNRMDNLYPCLESIRRHCKVTHETFVVAYMFSADNLAAARADFPEVEFIVSDEVRGFSENNNLALRRVSGRFCFVLNDDAYLIDGSLDRLVRDFDGLPEDAAIVAPRLLNPDGSLQLCGRPPYPARKYALQQWHLYSEPKDDTIGKTPVRDGIYLTSNISGAAFLIRTSVFRELGWFDERYFFTPEDIALSTVARKAGYKVYVDTEAGVVHKWRTTATASDMSVAIRPASIRGSLIFFSGGSALRYFLLGIAVWTAEAAKFLKASLVQVLRPGAGNRLARRTYAANCAAVFTGCSPKELFIRHRK